MKNLAMIACISADRGLGKENQLLWHFRDDMKFFRKATESSAVVMGSRTFVSIGRPLPKRRNIVLSRKVMDDNVEVVHSESELRKLLSDMEGPKFIIGGATLYEMFINDVEKIYLTEVAASRPADTYFPEFAKNDFDRKALGKYEEDGIDYQIVEYARKDIHD